MLKRFNQSEFFIMKLEAPIYNVASNNIKILSCTSFHTDLYIFVFSKNDVKHKTQLYSWNLSKDAILIIYFLIKR